MKCREARQLFFLYFDSELDPRSVQEVNLHLETCPECRARWNREVALEEAIARAAWRSAGPLEDFSWTKLENRIRAGETPRRPRRARLAAAVLLAVTVGALLAFGAWLFWRPGPSAEIAMRMAVEHHEELVAGKKSLQVQGPEGAAVRNFYAGQLGFEVIVPDGQSGEKSPPGLELLGARRCTFLGGPVAYISFRVAGRQATVILGPLKPPEALMDSITAAPGGVVEREFGGCRVILSSVHGLLFFAAGQAASEDLRRLLEAFRKIQFQGGKGAIGPGATETER